MKKSDKKIAIIGTVAIVIIILMGIVIQRQSESMGTSAKINLSNFSTRVELYSDISKDKWDKMDFERKERHFKELALVVSPVLRSNNRLCESSLLYKKYSFEKLSEFFLDNLNPNSEKQLDDCNIKLMKLSKIIEKNNHWHDLRDVKKSIKEVDKIF